ncbi:MAG: hypothetical protein KDE51_03535 [Anaerolineales bacterium]|nr:hypothetical protein [Anaerolineales bacterium]
MGFLKKLFGGGGEQKYEDKTGIYLYVRSKRGAYVKVRADKQHDLNRSDNGYIWHKTIVDSKYFTRMQATVYFDNNFNITSSELDGGEFISEADYEAGIAAEKS